MGKARAKVSLSWLATLLSLAVAGGCDRVGAEGALWGSERPEAPTLVRRVPLPPAVSGARTLSSAPGGRFWIGSVGEVVAVDALSGEPLLRPELETTAPPRLLGYLGDRYYLVTADELLTLDEDGVVRMRRGGIGSSTVALDPLGRHVYLATERGAVFGLDPRLLRPRWAWPRLGQPTAGAVSSPEGDRLYLLLGPDSDQGPRLLTRDVQTGRILAELELALPLRDLQVAASGWLFALEDEPGETRVVALQPGATGLAEVWRRSIPERAPASRVQLRVSPAGDRLIAFAAGSEKVAQVFDARTGRTLVDTLQPPIDAVFADDGALYLLFPEEVGVLQ